MKNLILGGLMFLVLLCGCQPMLPNLGPGTNREFDSEITIEDNDSVIFVVLVGVNKEGVVEEIKGLQELNAKQDTAVDAAIPLPLPGQVGL